MMALPSQSGVRSGGRQMMFRRKRRQLPPGLVPILAVIVVAGIGYLAWRQFGGPSVAGASTDPAHQPTAGGPTAAELLADAGQPAEPATPSTLGINDRRPQAASDRAPSRRDASGSLMGAIDRTSPREPDQATPDSQAATNTVPDGASDAGHEAQDTPARPAERTGPAAQPMGGSAQAATLVRLAQKKLDENEPVRARELFNRALAQASGSDAAAIRRRLGELNDELVFSPRIYPGDPIALAYLVEGGDALSKIVRKQDLAVDWRLIQRVNRLSSPSTIREGHQIKLVRGPFHAVVHKSSYRLDLYWGPPDERDEWVYIKSLPVGLGEGGSTPIGSFRVRDDGKLVNPGWANPRTGERFSRDDPKNPIGEFWVGIQGIGASAVHEGYGLHGTIEPDSIGRQASMGCVRLGDRDIELVFSLLSDGISRVEIEP